MILVRFDFVTQPHIFSCVYSVEFLCVGLDYIPAHFPKFLLCHSFHPFYSFYPCFQKEEEEVSRSLNLLALDNFGSASHNRQKMQQETGVYPCYHHHQHQHTEEEAKSDQAKEAFDILKKVSHDLKHNLGSFSKKFRLKKKLEKITLSSQAPAQLLYILLNSPEPLQIKLNEILSGFHNQLKSKLKICTNNTIDLSKYTPLESPEEEEEEEDLSCSCKEEPLYLPPHPRHTTYSHQAQPTDFHHVECMRRT